MVNLENAITTDIAKYIDGMAVSYDQILCAIDWHVNTDDMPWAKMVEILNTFLRGFAFGLVEASKQTTLETTELVDIAINRAKEKHQEQNEYEMIYA